MAAKKKSAVGRPTTCTPEITDKILSLIKAGNYRNTACAAVGIDARIMRRWLEWGAEGKEPYATFSAQMDEAEAQGEARHLLTIVSASKTDWRAASWILKTKYRHNWHEDRDADKEANNKPTEVRLIVSGPVSADVKP